jgi:hypothetical protein
MDDWLLHNFPSYQEETWVVTPPPLPVSTSQDQETPKGLFEMIDLKSLPKKTARALNPGCHALVISST